MSDYKFRIAEISDLSETLRMCEAFFSVSKYASIYDKDRERIVQYLEWFLTAPKNVAIVILLEHIPSGKTVGMLAMLSSMLPFKFEFMAYEQVWWVDPEHRKGKPAFEMLNLAEEWARQTGCSIVSLTALDDKVSKLYERKGYFLAEQAYLKRI